MHDLHIADTAACVKNARDGEYMRSSHYLQSQKGLYNEEGVQLFSFHAVETTNTWTDTFSDVMAPIAKN